jgi:hypothetical protein
MGVMGAGYLASLTGASKTNKDHRSSHFPSHPSAVSLYPRHPARLHRSMVVMPSEGERHSGLSLNTSSPDIMLPLRYSVLLGSK